MGRNGRVMVSLLARAPLLRRVAARTSTTPFRVGTPADPRRRERYNPPGMASPDPFPDDASAPECRRALYVVVCPPGWGVLHETASLAGWGA